MHTCVLAHACACEQKHTHILARVQKQSEKVGKCSNVLGFEVVSGERNVAVPVEGTCEYPRLSTDYRNVFYRKVGACPFFDFRSTYVLYDIHQYLCPRLSADYCNVFYRKVGVVCCLCL